MVYEKSTTGYREIAGNQRSLSLRQRQILIMVDGKRSENELAALLNSADVLQIIAELASMGHIQPAGSSASAAPSLPVMNAHTSTQNPDMSTEQLAAVKEIMVISSNECLGIMGRGLAQKIAAVETRDELKSWVSQWHMAIRESRLGKPLAGVLMEQVQQTMAI
jgi:hypothetical protein